MQTNKQFGHIHPLVAGASVSVMLVSLLGAAAITGILPTSHGNNAPASATPIPIAANGIPAASANTPAPLVAVDRTEPHHIEHHHVARQAPVPQYVAQAPVYQQPAPASTPTPAPVPVAQNSPVGIGVGAVVGGLLGNQIGSGNGRTLSTIAGAIGGGYVGNEIAKRNQ